MKEVAARRFNQVKKRLTNPGPRNCLHGHLMRLVEPGTWFCNHRDCQVLEVMVDQEWNASVETKSIYFDADESFAYRLDLESLSALVERRLEVDATAKRPVPPFRGITPTKNGKRYRAQIWDGERPRHLGTFDTAKEASRAYEAERAAL